MGIEHLNKELQRQQVEDSFRAAGLPYTPMDGDPVFIGEAEEFPPGWYAIGKKGDLNTYEMAEIMPLMKDANTGDVIAMEEHADPAVYGRWPRQPKIKGDDWWMYGD